MVKAPIAATKVWFDKIKKGIGDIPIPEIRQEAFAEVGVVNKTVRDAFGDAKDFIQRIKRSKVDEVDVKGATTVNAIFHPLKSWAEQSPGNWNILLGVGLLLLIGSGIFTYVFYRKIGQDDERTNRIFLKSAYCVLKAIVLCDIILPKDNMWNIFFLFKYGLAFLAGGIYLAIQYKKDLS